jgi:flagellar motility protein MotE (MotC chaperone)
MIQKLQSPLVAAIVGCLLYLLTMAVVFSPSKFAVAARAAVVRAHFTPDNDPSWRFRNPEMDQWIEEIKREKDALNVREQQLDELQKRLEAERQEILAVTQTVHQLQTEFDNNVVRIKDQEADNVRRQAKMISTMSPEGAAAMILEMPDEEVVRLLFMMKTDEASLILDTLSKQGKAQAKRAATVTEMLRRTLPPASTPTRPAASG